MDGDNDNDWDIVKLHLLFIVVVLLLLQLMVMMASRKDPPARFAHSSHCPRCAVLLLSSQHRRT